MLFQYNKEKERNVGMKGGGGNKQNEKIMFAIDKGELVKVLSYHQRTKRRL